MNFKKLKTGTIEEGKLQCVFLLVYCRNGMPNNKYTAEELENIPVVLSLGRHDGCIGFIGGKVDDGEMLLQGLYREIFEEINYKIDILRVKPLATYDDGNANIHSFKYEVNYYELYDMICSIPTAEHFGIEITGFDIKHINNYKNNGGIEQTLKQNWKATSKLELQELIKQENLL